MNFIWKTTTNKKKRFIIFFFSPFFLTSLIKTTKEKKRKEWSKKNKHTSLKKKSVFLLIAIRVAYWEKHRLYRRNTVKAQTYLVWRLNAIYIIINLHKFSLYLVYHTREHFYTFVYDLKWRCRHGDKWKMTMGNKTIN